jgi:hypothetical protein
LLVSTAIWAFRRRKQRRRERGAVQGVTTERLFG